MLTSIIELQHFVHEAPSRPTKLLAIDASNKIVTETGVLEGFDSGVLLVRRAGIRSHKLSLIKVQKSTGGFRFPGHFVEAGDTRM